MSNLPRLAVLSVALSVAMLCAVRMDFRSLKSFGAVAYGGFVLLTAVSACWATNKGESLYETVRWLVAGYLFLVLYHLHRRHPVRTVVMLSRVAAVVIVPSLAMALWQASQLGDLSWDNRYSITSLYSHKGTFSLMLFIAVLPVVLRIALRIRRARLFYIVLLVVVAAVLFFLAARTTFLALAMLLLVLLVSRIPFRPIPRRWHIPCTVALAVLLGVAAVGGSRLFCGLPLGDTPGAAGGVLSSASVYERYSLWNTTLRLIDRHPVLGVGAGNWKVCYPEVSCKDIFSVDVLDFTFVRPHNDYLRLLSETGYVGLFLLLLAVAAPMVRVVGHTARRRRGTREAGFLVAFVAACLAAALVDFPADRTELLLWFTLAFALLASAYPAVRLETPRRAKGKKQAQDKACVFCRLLRLASVVLLLSTLYITLHRLESEKQCPRIMAYNHAQMWKSMEESARDARTSLCTLTPQGIPFAYYEAMAREKQGKPALEAFNQALQDCPWHKQSLIDKARVLFTTAHEVDSAEALFKKAIFVSPSFSYAYFNLAQLYLQEGKPKETRQTLLSLDLDQKEHRMKNLVWHYYSGETARYYYNQLVPAERQYRDRLLALCDERSR